MTCTMCTLMQIFTLCACARGRVISSVVYRRCCLTKSQDLGSVKCFKNAKKLPHFAIRHLTRAMNASYISCCYRPGLVMQDINNS